MKRYLACLKHGIVLLTMLFLATTLTMTGCGGGGSSDSYDTPDSTVTAPLAGQTQNVLIDAATLKGWVDSGLVNNESSWEKVVILDVTSAASYAAGHIPGAQLWDSSAQVKNRVEGPVEAVNMTLDGASMDALVKSHGIDAGTTVVFTTTSANASSMFTLGRAYYLFRYWGFPKERLKVLNGFNKAWTDAGNALTIVAPTITASTYSVKNNPQFRADLRGSLAEVIAAVENQTMQVVDFRADGLPAGVVAGTAGWTAGVFNDDHNKDGVASQSGGDADFVVFEGTVKGSKYFNYTNILKADGYFKDSAALEAEFLAKGFDNSKKIISMCRTGMIASGGFLALDAIMGWDVMMYDGSWSQWGSLSTNTAKGGKLPAELADWATDIPELMDVTYYNADVDTNTDPAITTRLNIEPARINAPLAVSPYAPGANNIEDEDRAYFETPPAGGSTSTSGGGGGGC